MPHIYLGIDLGTTGVKVLAVDESGRAVGGSSEELELIFPKPGWSEQSPLEWWRKTSKAIKNVVEKLGDAAKNVKAISTSGQMHSLVLLDDEGNVLRNAILWNDQRTHRQCDEITEMLGNPIEEIGNPVLPGFTLPKILWVKEEEPEVLERTYKFILPKDYINYMLTDIVTTEHSDASGTGVYDVSRSMWRADILSDLGIPTSILPDVVESNEVVGKLRSDVARELGLPEGVLIIAGGADNACAALGAGVVKSGEVMVSLGTSGTVLSPTEGISPHPEGLLHFFHHVVSRTRYYMGVMLSATFSLKWFKDLFMEDVSYDEIDEVVSETPAGSNGVLFLPYLNGERTPHMDPFARGVLFGLSSYNTRGDILRSIYEGVAFGIKDSFDLLESMGVPVKEVRMVGGGSKSEIWRRITADVVKHPVWTVNVNEGASFGAAILARSGHSLETPESVAKSWVKRSEVVDPSDDTDLYEKLHHIYNEIYTRLKDTFRKIEEVLG